MIDIIMYSCVEVKDIIESIYRDVYGHSKVPLLAQREFFLRTFFLNFLCSCLEQPQVIIIIITSYLFILMLHSIVYCIVKN